MAHIRQPRPDYGRGFQVEVLETFSAFPSSLGSGTLIPIFPSERDPRTGPAARCRASSFSTPNLVTRNELTDYPAEM